MLGIRILNSIRRDRSTGVLATCAVPCAAVKPGQLLVGTSRPLVLTGTERMLVEFGKANWLDKARQQPDKVRMVLENVRTDRLLPTVEAVFNKPDQPLPLGYCNAGVVAELGAGVEGFAVGDRVVSNGRHAEIRAGFAQVQFGLEYAKASC